MTSHLSRVSFAALSHLQGVISFRETGKLRRSFFWESQVDARSRRVAEIKAEQALVNANGELIARMENKIQVTLTCVYGEGESTTVPVTVQ